MSQDVIFGARHDASLKNVLKGTAEPEEVLGHSPFTDMLEAIAKQMQLEAPLPDGADPTSSVVLGSDEGDAQPLKDNEVALTDLVPNAGEHDPDALREHLQALERRMKQFIKFVPMSEKYKTLALEFEGTALATTKLKKGTHPVLIYDTKCFGEANSQAHTRIPPFQKDQLKTVLRAWCTARGVEAGDENELGIVLVLDGFRPGLESSIGHAFQRPDGKFYQKSRFQFSVKYTEESLLARKQLQRGVVQQVESLHCFTTDGLVLKKKQRLHSKESNMASMIGDIVLPKHADVWRLAPEVKKEALGPKVMTGGACEVKTPKPVFSDAKEPISWHPQAEAFFAEVAHSFCAGVLVHATETDGSCAVHCVKAQVPYVGVTYTQKHADLLWAECLRRLWRDTLDDKSPIYNPSLANLLAGTNPVEEVVKPKKLRQSRKKKINREEEDGTEAAPAKKKRRNAGGPKILRPKNVSGEGGDDEEGPDEATILEELQKLADGEVEGDEQWINRCEA